MITPQDFVTRWGQSVLREQQAAQSHFIELCQLVGHKTPAEQDPEGKFFTFEEQVVKATGGKGRADVWRQGHFAWEYKGKHKSLEAAYAQLLAYRGALGNPPLLVVCDFLEYRIYPQWTNTSGLPFVFKNEDLLQADTRRYITWLLENPNKFLELRQTELERRERLTMMLAEKFAHMAELMRNHRDEDGKQVWEPMQIARFLTKLVFALFCEDVDIMPRPFNQPVFRFITTGLRELTGTAVGENFVEEMTRLFQAMNGERTAYITKPTPYFNGGIFAESRPGAGDGLEVLDLTQIPDGLMLLTEVSEADWRFVNPTIFGSLFEGALDVKKRSQLGAHYTGENDIRLVVDPVLMQPLYQEWESVRAEAEPLMQVFISSELPRAKTEALEHLKALHDRMMGRLENTTVLDPACGSGNFLYMSLKALKDLEGRVRTFFEPAGLPFRDVVTPRQLYGIEKDEFAANLAKVVVWIGYLQWRYEDEGILHPVLSNKLPHPRSLPNPIIKDKNSPDEPDRIICDDAVLRLDNEGKPYEPAWPPVDVIMGNPPFLGGKRLRVELGSVYLDRLFSLFKARVPHEADLVCYWHEKARAQLEAGKVKRIGLLATNSIRQTANRAVLDRIKQTGNIFMAWSDREWSLEGANVRISIIGYDNGSEKTIILDGAPVNYINADLQNTIDATKAVPLPENAGIAFMADTKGGAFDLDGAQARAMLAAVNASGRDNRDVVRPWVNGLDIARRPRDMWIIDFGTNMSLDEAQQYELPFQYVQTHVLPERQQNRRDAYRDKWWLHVEPRPGMRRATAPLSRYIGTVIVAKHRLFVWLSGNVLPDHQLYVFAREDDYFFGVLHSYLHERWSLRLGSTLEDRPRYVGERCFDSFPFPWLPGTEDIESAAHKAISAAAKALHEARANWLNPPEFSELGAAADSKAVSERTLTNLYNALAAYRAGNGRGNGNGGNGSNGGKEKSIKAARDFAPRLAELHDALDLAVLVAYGWDDLAGRLHTEVGDEEMLRRLLALNLQR